MKENHGRDKESRPEKSERLFDRKQTASKRARKIVIFVLHDGPGHADRPGVQVYIVPRHSEQL